MSNRSGIRTFGGRYRETGTSFSGGSGVVLLCDDINLDRKVAIKFIPDVSERRRLMDEIRALQNVQSKHVVDVYDIIVEQPDNQIGIVHEYLPGSDLKQYASAAHTPMEVLRVAYQAACGIAEIHRRSIIHRDIKPNNMKFTAEGVLKLFDFNLSRRTDQAQTIGFRGTLGFAAPELYNAGFVNFSTAVDVFALAVTVLTTLSPSIPDPLCRVPPVPDEWIASGGFATLGLPKLVASLLNQCLAVDPDSRPTAATLRDEIARHLLQDHHRALLSVGGQTYWLDRSRRTVSLQHPLSPNDRVELTYDGLRFRVTQTSGNVFINNLPINLGEVVPGACVVTLGASPLADSKRLFVTVDLSHPEVVL